MDGLVTLASLSDLALLFTAEFLYTGSFHTFVRGDQRKKTPRSMLLLPLCLDLSSPPPRITIEPSTIPLEYSTCYE
ncbi:hypothetical protein FB45DRAFT_169203 [Roridomyces roridus]|uniref:Uncharacterized protein n=1 Tax=Roridomyces roridus TaxID=1738132 RepID=A0AAD7FG91_9AGAR|nr:hypothetical protein FB45DRAFT_169203 [Roridomyces roridus]